MKDEPRNEDVPRFSGANPAATGEERHPTRRGRVAWLDEKKKAQVCAVVALGATIRTAAAYVRCDEKTIHRTRRRDPEFAADLSEAKSRGEIGLLTSIEKCSRNGEWRASSWLLVHCHRGQYLPASPPLPSERLDGLLTQLAALLLREVRDADDRRRIEHGLRALLGPAAESSTTFQQVESPS